MPYPVALAGGQNLGEGRPKGNRSGTGKALKRLTLVVVGLQHGVNLRQMKHSLHFRGWIKQFEHTPIPDRMGITGDQLTQTGTIDPGDLTEIDEHLGILLLECPLEFREFKG